MTKELDIPPELTEPPLLDDNIQVLVDEYLKLISKKMEEWTQNLMKSETQLFLERTEPPEEDADQMYTMQASGIMFQMVCATALSSAMIMRATYFNYLIFTIPSILVTRLTPRLTLRLIAVKERCFQAWSKNQPR